MANNKKSFKDSINPTMSFISADTVKAVDGEQDTPVKSTAPLKAPAGYKLNPAFIEIKSRRVQALVQPSVYEAVKARAQAEGISVNEAINNALRAYIEER